MKIKRDKLLNDLQDFALRGNGVVIGSPGVGKTYILKELRRNLESAEIPELLLPIDQLGDGTDETLKHELLIEENLIEFLKSIPLSHKKGIILFDAFDVARSEVARNNFLQLIRRAIQELDKWNIVVTVRTYDAKKSKELLDLFGNHDDTDLTEYQSKEILCRHFTICPFNPDEILQALGQIGYPETVYENGSDEFKGILSNPFNLWLLEKIIKFSPHEDIKPISQIRSEVQLLDYFWKQRIENENSERVLRRVSNRMVKERSLTVKVDDIYDDVDLDNPVRRTAWNKFQSDEILTQVSSTRQSIAFSHNILFDYAISVLHIEDDPKELEAFLERDQARALFLRPSLTYFFTRLWYYNDSVNFWEVFWYILPRDHYVHLRLVARLIPPSVIVNEARKVKELKPLFEKLSNPDDLINNAIMWLLQSLRTLQSEHDSLWIDFFDRVSEHLNVNFAMDLATLTSGILDRAIETDKSDIINTCGRIGRRLLEWVWQEKETKADDWYNRLGGYWAVPLVSKTFHTNVEESRILLEKVLKLMNEDNFPIGFLSRLSEHIDKIWDHDPEFVILIYRAVFSHQFTSEGETIRGGYVFAMKTFRSQDFGMCQYRLVNHFPKFLQAMPLHASQAVIQGLNYFILKEHIIRYQKEDVDLENLIETFNFRGKTTYFVKDDSYIWDAQNSSDKPIELADKLFEFIEELTVSKESLPLLDSLLDIFRDQAWVAFFWKRLLKTASKFPKVFAPRLFELCIAKPILLHLEVSYELGLFLENAASDFSSEQLRQIEDSILALPTVAKDQENDDYLEMHRNSLLARIPKELLSTEKAKLIREEMERENNVPENRPPITYHFESGTVTEEIWLKDKGVDTTTPENKKLQEYSQILEKFSNDWRKDNLTLEAAELILPQLQIVYTTITNDTAADNEIVNILCRKLVECAAILAGISDSLDSDSFTFCRQVILEGSEHELPLPNPQIDVQFDSIGYSPFPRHEAAKGLSLLAYHKPDTEILDAIEKLADDPVPSVRMLTAMPMRNVYAKNPDRYWKIIYKRSEFERNLLVQECLYRSLKFPVADNKDNENKTTTVMAKLLNHTPSPERKMGTSDPFISLLMWLVIERENSWAIDFIKDTYSNDPIQHSSLLTRIVRRTMENYVISEQLESDGDREIVKRAINCVSEVITVSSKKIKELCLSINENITEEKQQKLQNTYRVIDQVISSLYYSFAHEKGKSENQTEIISKEIRCHFYEEVKPLMNQVIDFADDPETGVMFASTAHYFMQLLTSFLSCNPKEVLHLAERVAKSSERFGYTLDSLAVDDVVKLVEIVLADYRHVVRDDEDCLKDLLNLLDLFAKTGWSDALNLVWRLDEVFR